MANDKRFVVKNGLQTQDINFESPDKTKNIMVSMLDTDVLSFSGNVTIPALTTETKSIEIGMGRTDNGISHIDLVGDTTYSDFGARFIRNGGPDASTQIRHRGVGGLRIETTDAAPILFLTSNAERMRIDATGNVGIGQVTPTQKLEVSGNIYINGTDGQGLFMNGGNGVFRASSNSMAIHANSAERVRIDSAGNVGIGITVPTCKLEVVAAAIATIPAAGAASSHLDVGAGAYGTLIGTRSDGVGYIQQQRTDGTATTYNLVLQPNGGNLRIGTAFTVTAAASTIDINAAVLPTVTNTHDLGSASLRWRNIYTQDLHLSNGIGDYTVVEGEEDLFIVNNKSGKSFKFALIEVDPSVVPPKSDV